MALSRWLALVGLLVGLGCLQVAQRNAVFLKGYAVGERQHRLHAAETDVSWATAQVVGLSSPTHLAHLAQERQLKLVAWSTLPASRPGVPPGELHARAAGDRSEPVRLAATDDATD